MTIPVKPIPRDVAEIMAQKVRVGEINDVLLWAGNSAAKLLSVWKFLDNDIDYYTCRKFMRLAGKHLEKG